MNDAHHNHKDHHMHEDEDHTSEYIKFGFIIILIGLVALYLEGLFGSGGIADYIRYFMGVFLITFATFKFWNLEEFPDMFAQYDKIAGRFIAYGYIYPFIQMILGAMYLADLGAPLRDIITLVVSGVSAHGVIDAVYLQKNKLQCACLGNIIKLPLSTVTLVEDLGMVLMVLIVFLAS